MSITKTAAGTRDSDVTRQTPKRRSGAMDLAALTLLTVTGSVVGGWALADPLDFYLGFPGLGRHWVMPDGPFNEHLVRDVGALNLALGVLALVAAARLTKPRPEPLAQVTGLVWLVFSVPHLVYHLDHAATLKQSDSLLQGLSLTLVVGLAGFLARPRRPIGG